MSLLTSFCPSFVSSAATTAGEKAPARQPSYQVAETAEAYTVTVQLPGVAKDGVDISAEDGVLTVTGRRSWQKPDAWTARYRESAQADYTLALTYDDAVEVDQVQAALTDGVLRLTLPKAEARKPRKITVN